MARPTLLAAFGIATLLAAPGRAEPGTALVAGASQPLQVLRLEGVEAISSLFRYQLDLVATATPPFPLLGKEVTVTLPLPDGSSRHFSGIVSRVGQGRTEAGATFHRAEVVPALWLLTRKARSRQVQGRSVPEIVAEVLDEAGIAHEELLQQSYSERDCVVQYRETDFRFVSRLLEEEGIFYFFRHEAGGHTMVLADTPLAHPSIQGGAVPIARPRSRTPGITEWEKVQELRSGKTTLRDHVFQLPGEDFEASASIQESVAVGRVSHLLALPGSEALELYDFPGEYAQRFDGVDELDRDVIREEGQRTAETRMQEEAARAIVLRGSSNVVRLVSGHRFTLTQHVDAAGPYVVTSVQHTATRRSGSGAPSFDYANTFTCIPAGLPFRPERTTPRPVVGGPQAAVVTGPAGQTSHVDDLGRIKLAFPWDRERVGDERSSCWVPVATLSGGGSLAVPEIGDQVLVDFEEGDPDRPVVIGSFPNPER